MFSSRMFMISYSFIIWPICNYFVTRTKTTYRVNQRLFIQILLLKGGHCHHFYSSRDWKGIKRRVDFIGWKEEVLWQSSVSFLLGWDFLILVGWNFWKWGKLSNWLSSTFGGLWLVHYLLVPKWQLSWMGRVIRVFLVWWLWYILMDW